MLRLYIRRLGRLHIWDSELRYPGVSMVHNHSWDLASTVVAGYVFNHRYTLDQFGEAWMRRRLITGYECRFVEDGVPVTLLPQPQEVYAPGDVYVQKAHEIHRTDTLDVTVTLMERAEDVEGQADVFWRKGETWGTAKPRPATPEEITRTVERAILQIEAELRK